MQNTKIDNNVLSELNCPAISPVPEGVERPCWSVMIPTYNPIKRYWLEQTIDSVLAQDPGPEDMQIELIDDCSTDFDPEDIVKKVGENRVTFYRQKHHAGIARNWNTCIERARGYWVHILHQDDLVLPGFYSRLREGIEKEPSVGAAFCQHFHIDSEGNRKTLLSRVEMEASGILNDWLEYVFVGLSFQCPSIVVKRSVYEELGGFNLDFQYAMDWDMWKRIASMYPIWYSPKPLACFRRNYKSTASEFIRSGRNISELRKSIEISKHYLPKPIASKITRKAREYYTRHAVRNAWDLLFIERDFGAAIVQVWNGRKLSSSLMIVRAIVGMAIHTWCVRR